jgi:hypothetical protein
MPPQKRVTIAQISDLHINRRVDRNVTTMLTRILEKCRPDVLIVSGDLANQPVPWQMKRAAKLLREIVQRCAPKRVIVIPGNHDFKFWGNVGLRRLTRIPFEIYFRREGLDHSFPWRVWQFIRLALSAVWWRSSELREPVIADMFDDHPGLGIAVFAVNSNTLTEMMAAGKVESDDLQRLFTCLDKADESPDFAFRYKIAVVHHHPAPIADAPSDAIARIQDSFMIFYNAGLFVRELSRRHFSLVLHGHKHVAGFLRVSCEFGDQGRTILPIAAAGTASHPAPDDTRGHHMRVVEIFDDDTARLHERFFSADVEEKDESRTYELDTLGDVRLRRYAILRGRRGYAVQRVTKTVSITGAGYSVIRKEYCGTRAVTRDGLDRIRLILRGKRPTYLRGLEPIPESSTFATIGPVKQDLYNFEGEFELGRRWKPEDGRFNWGYLYRLMNGHVLKADEFRMHYYGTKVTSEYASLAADGAYDLLILNVQFPDKYDLNALEFRAEAEYAPAPLHGTDEGGFDYDTASLHDEETARISTNVQPSLPNGYCLTCPNPVPGMLYKLSWRFRKPQAAQPEPDLALGEALSTACEKLLTLPSVVETPEWNRAVSVLKDLATDANSILGGPGEDFHVTVMVYDEGTRLLKPVCANFAPLSEAAFFPGEGCAGFVFEKTRSVLYHAKRDQVGYFIHQEEWPTGEEIGEPVVLASFPWIYGEDRWALGVINFTSKSKTTKLLRLFNALTGAANMQKIEKLANLAAERLLAV